MFSIRTNVLHKNTFSNQACYGMRYEESEKWRITEKNIIANRLRKARLAFDPPLTQDQLSGRLATRDLFLDRVAITKIESSQRCVFDFELPVLAQVLNVDVRWLLGMQSGGGPIKKKGGADDL